MLQLPAPIEFFHEAARVAPTWFRLYIEFQEDFRSEHALHLYPRRGADLLQHPTAFAHPTSLVSVALSINRSTDVRESLPFFKVVDDHRRRVRNFLTGVQQNLLADDFRGHESGRLIGDLVLRKISRASGKRRKNHFH